MADVYGKASVIIPLEGTAPGTATVLYQCPEVSAVSYAGADNVAAAAQDRPIQTQVTSLVLCHWGAGGSPPYYVNAWHTSGDIVTTPYLLDGINEKDLILHNYDVNQNATVSVNLGILMSAGEKIWIEAEALNHISATLYYIEVS